MAQLTVRVNKLNQRKGPVTNFADKSNVVSVVNTGYTFESQGIIKNNLGTWHSDADGYYYWEEGLEESDAVGNSFSLAAELDLTKMSWAHSFYNIPSIWKDLKTAGRGVIIALIDTGIDTEHFDLKDSINSLSKSFVTSSNLIDDEDGHGTRMAGIIAGKGNNKVFGIAPEASLMVIKGTVYKGGVNINEFIDAINYASSIAEVDVISISYSFTEDNASEYPNLKIAIENSLKAGKVIVAAIGNAHSASPDKPTFPACYNKSYPENGGILAVGAFNSGSAWCDFSNCNDHLRCLAPGDTLLTTQIGNSSFLETGTSIATAFTAACVGLLISYCKLNDKSIKKCVSAIINNCDYIGTGNGFDIQNGYGKINLEKAISQIKSDTV